MMDHERVRKLRQQLGVSQVELCKATGLNRTVLSAFETGQIGLKGDWAQRVRDFFASRGKPLPEPSKPPAPNSNLLKELRWLDEHISALEQSSYKKGLRGYFSEESELERAELLVLLERHRVLSLQISGTGQRTASLSPEHGTQADFLAAEYLTLLKWLDRAA